MTHVSQISHGIFDYGLWIERIEVLICDAKRDYLQAKLWPQNCFGGVMTTEDFR